MVSVETVLPVEVLLLTLLTLEAVLRALTVEVLLLIWLLAVEMELGVLTVEVLLVVSVEAVLSVEVLLLI